MVKKISCVLLYYSIFLIFFICNKNILNTNCIYIASNDTIEKKINTVNDKKNTLILTFAGDIMAHEVNYIMDDFSLIYDDIRSIFLFDDIRFANIESPVADSLPFETYPTFNMQGSYIDAAIHTGFNVFSLANNHTNDQGIAGIQETMRFFEQKRTKHQIAFSGLKDGQNECFSYSVIEKNGFKILFLAVTEILNTHDSSVQYINYVPKNESGRKNLTEYIQKLKTEQAPDIFILSVHVLEEEYIRDVTETRKMYFRNLAECGVDIIWAHHPHVMQEWEIIDNSKLIMYSMGNFISGQRYAPNFENPERSREYTGDSILLQVTLKKEAQNDSISIAHLEPIMITNYTDKKKNVTVRLLTEDFIASQPKTQAEYYRKRLQLMEELY